MPLFKKLKKSDMTKTESRNNAKKLRRELELRAFRIRRTGKHAFVR